MTPALANHLLQSTIFAAVAGILTLCLRNNHARTRYWIWLTASIKFLIPFALFVELGHKLTSSTAPVIVQPRLAFVMDEISQPFTAPQAISVASASSIMPELLLAVWILGSAAVLIFWFVRWRRVAAILRASLQITEGREISALRRMDPKVNLIVSSSQMEPGVFGILRPVLSLPTGISDHLNDAQLDAIFAHELSHVYHRDNLTAALHMLVQAVFWFHPLVWWIGAKLIDERERACDEDVVRRGSDPEIYAESILRICRLYLELPLVCAAGISGSDLGKRIENIMKNQATGDLIRWKRILLLTAVFASVACPVTIGFLHPDQAEPRKAFEVASIRPNPSEENRTPHGNKETPGGIDYKYIGISNLITQAFGVKNYQLVLPRGYQPKPWEIIAKAPPNSRVEDIPLMLRSLLADRFHLAFHRETKEMQVYELVVAKTGSKLKEVDPSAHGLGTSRGTAAGLIHVGKDNTTLANLAYLLTDVLRMPVLDKTGLPGAYEIDFEYEPLETNSSLPGPSIFDAMEKTLGLKLQPRKDPIEILVVDHLDTTPTEN